MAMTNLQNYLLITIQILENHYLNSHLTIETAHLVNLKEYQYQPNQLLTKSQ